MTDDREGASYRWPPGAWTKLPAAELAGEEHASAAGPVVALPEPKEQQ